MGEANEYNNVFSEFCHFAGFFHRLLLTFWGFVSGGVKDALTFGLRLMFVDITEP